MGRAKIFSTKTVDMGMSLNFQIQIHIVTLVKLQIQIHIFTFLKFQVKLSSIFPLLINLKVDQTFVIQNHRRRWRFVHLRLFEVESEALSYQSWHQVHLN